MNSQQPICIVCNAQNKAAKYRCPTCFVRYCSLDCFKLHKNDNDKDYSCMKQKEKLEQQKQQQSQQDNQQQQQQNKNNDLILDENDVIVPEQRIQKAVQNEKIKSYLSHSKLKQVIREIDGARHKKKALWKRMKNDPDFQVFIDTLLNELGYINKDGQFEVTNDNQ